jgi:hypothetical protein
MPLATRKTKSSVAEHHINLRTKGTLPEAYSLSWGVESNTGCWRYDAAARRHIISLNAGAYDCIADKGITRGQADLFKLIYEHEAAHSLYTVKELAELGELLKLEKIPWRLMNLFEDIRIERMWWREQRKHANWRWTRWSKHPTDLTKMSPTLLLFRFKCGDVRRGPNKALRAYAALPYYHQVWAFFVRICGRAKERFSTVDLVPILKEWLKSFPETGDESIGAEEGALGTGDIRGAIESAGGSVEEVAATGGTTTTAHGTEAKGGGEKEATREAKAIEREAIVATQLERMLATAFRSVGPTTAPTSDPARRLNMKGLLRGDWTRPYIGRTVTDNGAPYVSVLFDGSGSMNGQRAFTHRDRRGTRYQADEAGRVLVRALSGLAAKKLIRGVVYLTGTEGVRARMELPIKNASHFALLRGTSSHEGLGLALSMSHRGALKEIAANAKLALVYTDGCITDAPIDRASLRAKGIYTVGLCAAEYDMTENLKEHFDSYISRDSLFGLADALVRFLRSHKF